MQSAGIYSAVPALAWSRVESLADCASAHDVRPEQAVGLSYIKSILLELVLLGVIHDVSLIGLLNCLVKAPGFLLLLSSQQYCI